MLELETENCELNLCIHSFQHLIFWIFKWIAILNWKFSNSRLNYSGVVLSGLLLWSGTYDTFSKFLEFYKRWLKICKLGISSLHNKLLLYVPLFRKYKSILLINCGFASPMSNLQHNHFGHCPLSEVYSAYKMNLKLTFPPSLGYWLSLHWQVFYLYLRYK
jgi:hypothetical protein